MSCGRSPSRCRDVPHPGMEYLSGRWLHSDTAEQRREQERERYVSPGYRERARALKKKRYANDPEYRESVLERQARYRGTAAGMLSGMRYNATKRRDAS